MKNILEIGLTLGMVMLLVGCSVVTGDEVVDTTGAVVNINGELLLTLQQGNVSFAEIMDITGSSFDEIMVNFNRISDEMFQEFFEELEGFEITYDANSGNVYHQGELVRAVLDGFTEENGMIIGSGTLFSSIEVGGIIDVFVIRDSEGLITSLDIRVDN